MNSFETVKDLAAAAGRELGVSDWVLIDQDLITQFARLTGDMQWIHVDAERARRESSTGLTVAHGYLILALIPQLLNTVYEVRQKRRAVNYGLNRVRFLTPVPPGGRLRLRARLLEAQPMDGCVRFTFEDTIELEGAGRPAAVAEAIILIYE